MTDHQRVWIEFVGIPGAGKSTIARILEDRLRESGYDCVSSPGFAHAARNSLVRGGRLLPAAIDLVLAIRFTYQLRNLWKHLLPTIWQGHFLPRYWRLMRIWAAMGRLARASRRRSTARVIIFDQGILQCLRSVYPDPVEDHAEQELTRKGAAAMNSILPDLVVVVCIDESTASERMRTRPFQRTAYDLESPDLEEALSPHRRYAERVLPAALNERSIPVLHLNGTVDPQKNAARIMEESREIFHEHRVAVEGLCK